MKMFTKVCFLVLLSLFNVSFALALSQDGSGEKIVKYGKSFSYSVTAASINGSTLHIDAGMAVAITMLENKCILATAKHIVQNASSIMVAPLSNSGASHKKIKADVIYLDGDEDVAFLSFTTQTECGAPYIAVDENKLIGRSAVALKCSSDGDCHTAKGHIIGFYKLQDGREFMIADMPTEVGFSGSGVFDDEGNLIGLVSGRNDKANVACLISGPRIIYAFKKSKK